MHYLTWSPTPPAAPTTRQVVVLLHGIGDYSFRWQFLGQSLAERGYTVLAPDMFGHGRSPLPGPKGVKDKGLQFDAAAHVEQIAEFLTAAGVAEQEKIVLIGFSMGGAVAATFNATYPARVCQLGLFAPAGLMPPGPEKVLRSCFGCCWRFGVPLACLRGAASSGQEGIYKEDFFDHGTAPLFPWFAQHSRLQRAVNKDSTDSFIGSVMQFELGGLDATVDKLAEHLAASPTTPAPTLLMWGKQDTTVPVSEMDKWLTKLGGKSSAVVTKVIDGAAHSFMLERMEETHATIFDWIIPPP